ncbi:hypothetical protein P7C70_g2670, partial [Phenoliferia sp. Uapishka_3]
MVSYKFVTAAALVASASAITINSPTGLTTCEPSAITWSGGTAPYYVTILPGGEVSGTVLETLVSDSSATTYTWNVNIAGGSYVTFAAKVNHLLPSEEPELPLKTSSRRTAPEPSLTLPPSESLLDPTHPGQLRRNPEMRTERLTFPPSSLRSVNVTDPVTSSVSGATAGSTTVLSSSTSASTKASSTAGSSSGSSSKSGSATTSGTSSAASASSSDSSSAATKIYGSFGIAGVLAALAVVLV